METWTPTTRKWVDEEDHYSILLPSITQIRLEGGKWSFYWRGKDWNLNAATKEEAKIECVAVMRAKLKQKIKWYEDELALLPDEE